MLRLAAATALFLAAGTAWADPERDDDDDHRGRSGVVSASAVGGRASVAIRLVARVVSTTSIRLSGREGTHLVAHGRRGHIDLGAVDAEGRHHDDGRAVERSDDGGAFHIAEVRAVVGFSQGVRGQLLVSGEIVEDGPGIDFRYACREVPSSAYRHARSAAARGTRSLRDGGTVCASELADRDHVDLELAVHVADETPEGRYGATYFVTAVPDLI